MTMEISPDAATPQEFRLQLNRASYRRLFCSGAAGGKPIPGCDGDARDAGDFFGNSPSTNTDGFMWFRQKKCDFMGFNGDIPKMVGLKSGSMICWQWRVIIVSILGVWIIPGFWWFLMALSPSRSWCLVKLCRNNELWSIKMGASLATFFGTLFKVLKPTAGRFGNSNLLKCAGMMLPGMETNGWAGQTRWWRVGD